MATRGPPPQSYMPGLFCGIYHGKIENMYRVMDESSGNVVGIKVQGKLTQEDYVLLVPYLEHVLAEWGPLHLLCDMTDFGGVEIGAFWEDFKFSLRHLGDFQQMAIVGDQQWLTWLTKLFNPMVKAEVKYFPSDQMDRAWAWVKT